jgi:hypothetical protein
MLSFQVRGAVTVTAARRRMPRSCMKNLQFRFSGAAGFSPPVASETRHPSEEFANLAP